MSHYIEGRAGQLYFGDPDDPATKSVPVSKWKAQYEPTPDDDGQPAPLSPSIASEGTIEFVCDVDQSESLVAFQRAIDDDFTDAELDFWTNHPGESSRVYKGLRTGAEITISRSSEGDA